MTISTPQFIEVLRRIYPTPRVIFDIGAMDGACAILMKEAFPNSTVHGFEACPAEWRDGQDRCTTRLDGWHKSLLWSRSESLRFHTKELRGIHSVRNRIGPYPGTEDLMDSVRLDEMCLANAIPKPDVVKLDVEGCALDVLCGFGELLRGVCVLHTETEQEELFEKQRIEGEVFSFLREAGMTLLMHSLCCYTQYDSIWVRKEMVEV